MHLSMWTYSLNFNALTINPKNHTKALLGRTSINKHTTQPTQILLRYSNKGLLKGQSSKKFIPV